MSERLSMQKEEGLFAGHPGERDRTGVSGSHGSSKNDMVSLGKR